ncbi:MAG: hypothetical protein PWQ79_1229 [Thermococcaceae archaeon]|nr:hypothetical protein [Thermococcaceae archaeon]MDK2914314.1 hypothetical protein [Thermococcaceae archaeon]
MNSRELFLYLFVLTSATAWELFLAYLPGFRSYFTRSGVIHLERGVVKCWKEYSPSLTFVILALLPAIVLIALHIYLKNPILKKSGLSVGITTLFVILMAFITSGEPWLLTLLLVSIMTGAALGEDKVEKALLAIQGFIPATVLLIAMGLWLNAKC